MSDEKKPLDPAVEKIIDAIAGMPEPDEADPPSQSTKSRKRKEGALTIRFVHRDPPDPKETD